MDEIKAKYFGLVSLDEGEQKTAKRRVNKKKSKYFVLFSLSAIRTNFRECLGTRRTGIPPSDKVKKHSPALPQPLLSRRECLLRLKNKKI